MSAFTRKPTSRGEALWTLQQAMVRVVSKEKAANFFNTVLGTTLIERKAFPQWKFGLDFCASLDDPVSWPAPGTPEAHSKLWNLDRCAIELTENEGVTEYKSGNEDEFKGFGHLAFSVPAPIAEFCAKIEKEHPEIQWKKRLTDGRMKDIAFVLEPSTGIWVELIEKPAHNPAAGIDCGALAGQPSFHHCMVRVKDPKVSIPFYEKNFGMSLVAAKHFPEMTFSVYFLGTFESEVNLPTDPESEEAWTFMRARSEGLLELCHNHGTENDPDFKGYCVGNDGKSSYGHIGFIVSEDLAKLCVDLEEKQGVKFRKRPHEGSMRGLAFALDPDGYSIEIIQRGLPTV
jgi:lactoylglutathione lyase